MKIGIHDSEARSYPNLALMKVSAYHKSKGHSVNMFSGFDNYDVVYSSKVFTWTKQNPYLPKDTIFGGTGNNSIKKLPEEVEHTCPDYDLYKCEHSYGFLTRGCPNKCSWCFVPEKEGDIKPHADIDEFLRHDSVILMDNNVLAHSHGIEQIKKMINLGVKVDFNQGLDARFITDDIAQLLSGLKWLKPLRMACDSQSQIKSIEKAVKLLRFHGCTPKNYFIYTLIKDVDESEERINRILSLGCDPFGQPYRDKINTPPTLAQKQLARWVNMKSICKSCSFDDYQKTRGYRV